MSELLEGFDPAIAQFRLERIQLVNWGPFHGHHVIDVHRDGTLVTPLSDSILGILDKGHTAAEAHRALGIVRAAGLSLRPTFVPFTPWTTLDDYRALVRFIDEQKLHDEVDPIQLSLRLLVPPGSLLLDRPELRPHLGELDPERLTFSWRHPDPAMDALQLEIAALVEEKVRQPKGIPTLSAFAGNLLQASRWPGNEHMSIQAVRLAGALIIYGRMEPSAGA